MTRAASEPEALAAAIRDRWKIQPRAGMVLGTGCGRIAELLDVAAVLDFDVDGRLPATTAPGHRGRWVCGKLAGTPVVAMDGRLHGYEGHRGAQIAAGVRAMHALGIDTLVVSNACGGLHPDFRVGDVMVIDDQINLTFDNPLVGPHDASSGLGYPDMSRPFDPGLLGAALAAARRHGIAAHRGVYVGVLGPNYETRAEYRFLRRIGGDAVGMSTVHEVIAARQLGLRVLGLSLVTNECRPDRPQRTAGAQVVAAAQAAAPAIAAIVADVLQELPALSPD